MGFHSSLNDLVLRICQKRLDKVSGYNLMKKHLAEQELWSQKKRKVIEDLSNQPSLKKNSEEKGLSDRRMIVVDTKNEPITQQISEDKSKHEAHDDIENDGFPHPEPRAPSDEELPPPPSASEEFPITSLAKNVVVDSFSKLVLEEGEIPLSEPSAREEK